MSENRDFLIPHRDSEEIGVHCIANAEADMGVVYNGEWKQSIETSVERDVGFDTTVDALGQS